MLIHGKDVTWDTITKEELEYLSSSKHLPDALIAQEFHITKDEVKKKRYAFGLKQYSMVTDQVFRHYPLCEKFLSCLMDDSFSKFILSESSTVTKRDLDLLRHTLTLRLMDLFACASSQEFSQLNTLLCSIIEKKRASL